MIKERFLIRPYSHSSEFYPGQDFGNGLPVWVCQVIGEEATSKSKGLKDAITMDDGFTSLL